MDKFDILILGGGPGGYVAAIKAAQLGASVAVIEREKLGGVCLNWGCIPTKTLLITAKHYRDILNSEEFGIEGVNKDDVRVNWESLIKRKDSVVNRLVSGVGMLFKKNKVTLIEGEGKVLNKNQIEVNGQIIEGKSIILATGASNKFPDIQGLDEAFQNGRLVVSKEALNIKEIPKELVIFGSSPYAIEFATLFNAIGSNVVLIFESDQILEDSESEMARTLERQLKKDGIKILSKSKVLSFKDDGVQIERKGKEELITADKYMGFWGAKPNTESFIDLGLELNSKGYVITNERLETNIKGIYAIGDLNGKQQLAHTASAEGIVAAENIMGVESKLNYNLIPTGVYSFPELASVGLTEEEAKEKGLDYKVSKFPFQANGMALAQGDTTGFVKIISDNKYGEIIGVHILSSDAMNLISKAVALMQLEATVYDLAKTIHPHPTLAEAMVEAAYGAIGGPINM